MKEYNRIGCIGRWKPFHLGGSALLETLCEKSNEVIIGLGSANKEKYGIRNPFTAEESRGMIDASLSKNFSNYKFIAVPDFTSKAQMDGGQIWRQYVVEHFKELDAFVSGNEYVVKLLQDDYKMISSFEIVPKNKQIDLKASMVRLEMARGGDWGRLLKKEVAEYIIKNELDKRFIKEFGIQTIANESEHYRRETADEEERNICAN